MPTKPILDSHVHLYTDRALDILSQYRQDAGLEGLCLASIGCMDDAREVEQNLLALLLKREDTRFYAYGSLVYPALPVPETLEGRWDLAQQAKALLDAGFDGVKLLESKPGYRKKLGMPLDAPQYDGFFSFLEKAQAPVLWHVADPETFWDASTAPQFALDAGWVYIDGTFPTKQSLYDEVTAVLDRHPALHVAFAHFYFLSAFETEARALLEKYPNVWLDLTPGIEMYENFSLQPDRWHAFFSEYQDRLTFGTDHCDTDEEHDPVDTVECIVRFLSTRDTFSFWGRTVQGIGLDEKAVRAIVHDNFIRRTGSTPRPVSDEAFRTFYDRWQDCIDNPALADYLKAYREALS